MQFLTNASTRDEGKKQFNIAVFGRPQESGGDLSRFQRFLRKQIREKFPSVFRWLDARKRSSYKNVHNLLTREESRLVRKAQTRMLEAGIPFLNVHDAVYVRERDAAFAKGCLEDLHFLVNEASCDHLWREWNEEPPGDLWKKRAFLVRMVKKKDPRSEDTHASSFTRLGRRLGVGREIEEAFEGESEERASA